MIHVGTKLIAIAAVYRRICGALELPGSVRNANFMAQIRNDEARAPALRQRSGRQGLMHTESQIARRATR
jgi:hypothetical protein